MTDVAVEWVRISPEAVVVATEERAWITRPGFEDPFSLPMTHAGTPETTRRLLEGCIAAAQQAAFTGRPRPPLTRARWAWRLAGYYHTTHATPRLMREAAERFTAMGRPELAEYAALKVADEGGHDDLALRDLRALGYPAETLVREWVPPTAAALVEYFTTLVRGPNPIGCIGYAYALERLAVAVPKDYLRQVEAVLPPGVNATRCLRVHSSSGADLSHVEDAVLITASLPPEERIQVAVAGYHTAVLCSTAPPEGHVPEEELERCLSASSAVPAAIPV